MMAMASSRVISPPVLVPRSGELGACRSEDGADPPRRDRRPALARSRRGLERRRVTFGQAEGALLEHPSNDLPALGVRQLFGACSSRYFAASPSPRTVGRAIERLPDVLALRGLADRSRSLLRQPLQDSY